MGLCHMISLFSLWCLTSILTLVTIYNCTRVTNNIYNANRLYIYHNGVFTNIFKNNKVKYISDPEKNSELLCCGIILPVSYILFRNNTWSSKMSLAILLLVICLFAGGKADVCPVGCNCTTCPVCSSSEFDTITCQGLFKIPRNIPQDVRQL